jgi:hypothetical protein
MAGGRTRCRGSRPFEVCVAWRFMTNERFGTLLEGRDRIIEREGVHTQQG